ncbi:hypothetical protein YYG_03464 [Plasmodium vinckei petteri]|uniref:RAP protein, putative n=1 Tax=Plasmodium vinckei petteri TaxID=138298 RepID=W7ADN3_PLAVN|nr:hypothetical protein YYG_03464 [Plasmodium vinckei petteri]CAD2111510.1 RAP protein, putative [Plasmodium vinckei petteri]
MLRICGSLTKLRKLRNHGYENVKFFTTITKNQKDTLKAAVKINKDILKSDNILEIIKIVKDNEKNTNIINHVTFFHRLMQIIHQNNNDASYVKNKKYINIEIEKRIKIIFAYLSNDKENLKKVNNYNKRLFSSFVWSLSKYFILLKENVQDSFFKGAEDFIFQEYAHCKENNSKIFTSHEKSTNKNDNTATNHMMNGGDPNKSSHIYKLKCERICKQNPIKIKRDIFSNLDWKKYDKHIQPKNNNHEGKPITLSNVYLNLLLKYANVYLPHLSPSRHVVLLWSLSKLNKNSKEIHENYYKQSLNIIPQLKDNESIILLYSYSYVNFKDFDFYLKIKKLIMNRSIHKKIVHEKNYESLISMLLSFSNQNIFFQDLYKSTINSILETNNFLNNLRKKNLIRFIFCIFKLPHIYLQNENTFVKNQNESISLWKNVILYELLKKKVMKKCDKLFPLDEDINCSIRRKSFIDTIYKDKYPLGDIILLLWSLSLKYIYSANLFLYTCIKLNSLLKSSNFINNYFQMLTNFYLSLLSFILEDQDYINLYFNKNEANALSLLYDYLSIHMDNFVVLKDIINMNTRHNNDVEISNMQENIFYIISNYFKPSKNIIVLLEYKNVVNLSVDILLYRNDNFHHNNFPKKRNDHNCSYVSFLGKNIFRGTMLGPYFPEQKINQKHICTINNFTNFTARKKKNHNLQNNSPVLYLTSRKNMHTTYAHFFSTIGKNDIDEKSYHPNECANLKSCVTFSPEIEDTIKDPENSTNNMYRFINKLKNISSDECNDQLKIIYNDLILLFNNNFIYIKKNDVISFFYKFSSFFPTFCKMKNQFYNVNEVVKLFSFFINFTTSTFFPYLEKNINKNKERNLNLFIDVCWTYFRYMKYLTVLSKNINSNTNMSSELEQINIIISNELDKTENIFNHTIKSKITDGNMITELSSKNMSLLISIFLHLKNSNDIINYLQKNNFFNMQFYIKDIIYILSALLKSDYVWKDLEIFFCKMFTENIAYSDIKNLVEFTYLCAELKCNHAFIVSAIRSRINEFTNLPEAGESKQNTKYNFDKFACRFIEKFTPDELAFFTRNCYRMHCFDRTFFDLLCDTAAKKLNALNLTNACIILPCFSRVYCIKNIWKKSDEYAGDKKQIINKDINIKIENNDYLEKNISSCRYKIPESLKVLVNHVENEMIPKRKNITVHDLCYFMESLTLLKIENKKLYNLCINETLKKIQNFVYDEKEIKIIGKILWCLSYYHKTEYLFSHKIINFLLKYKLYQNPIPENFISFFLYFIKSRVYNKKIFYNIGKTTIVNITINNYFTPSEEKRSNFKLNVITELYATMAWAYAFTYFNNADIETSNFDVHTNRKVNVGIFTSKEENSCKNNKHLDKNYDNKEINKCKDIASVTNPAQLCYTKKDQMFLKKIYDHIFNEIKILHEYRELSFLLLARYLWGVSIVNLINDDTINFINTYNWDEINIYEQNPMYLHMVFTLWLRLKYSYSHLNLSKNFLNFIDQITHVLKKIYIKKGLNKDNLSTFHVQISKIFDKFNIKYTNEYITKDLLIIDIIILLKDCKEKIAIEIDGPSHHLLDLNDLHVNTSTNDNKKYLQCGTTYFKNFLLKKNGWKVINIPSYEWNKIKKEDRDYFIIQKLSNCSSYLKQHFVKNNQVL